MEINSNPKKQFFNIKRNKWLLNIIICFISTEEKIRMLPINKLLNEIISESEEFTVIKNIVREFQKFKHLNVFTLLSKNSRILDNLVKSKISEISFLKSNSITGLKANANLCKEEIERIMFILIGRKLHSSVIIQDYSTSQPNENFTYRFPKNLVNFDSLYMRSIGSSYLSKSLMNFQKLQVLNLRKNLIGPLGVENICHLVERIPTIIHLDLSENLVGTMGTFSLANIVKKPSCQLNYLNIDQNIVKDTSLLYLLDSLKKNVNLRQFIFSLGNFNYDALFYKRLGYALHQNNKVSVTISCIEQVQPLDDTILTILKEPLLKEIKFNLITKSRSWKRTLEVESLLLDKMKIGDFISHNYTSTKFLHKVEDEYVIASLQYCLNNFIQDDSKSNLKELDVEILSLAHISFENSNKNFFKIVKNSKIMKKFAMSNLIFKEDSLRYFIDALIGNKSIKVFQVKRNEEVYVEKIIQHNKSLKKVSLENINVSKILPSLSYNNRIEILNFNSVDFTNKEFRRLVRVLSHNKTIKRIHFNSGRLILVKGIHLRNLLSKTCLEYISIRNLNLLNRSKYIAKGIKTSKNLRRLSLDTKIEVFYLGYTVLFNDKIQCVDLYEHHIEIEENPKLKLKINRED